MASAIIRLEQTRDMLSRAIVQALESWPDLHRRVFVQSHYRGDNEESISRRVGVTAGEVRRILRQCDQWLCAALRTFKERAEGEPLPPADSRLLFPGPDLS